MNELYIIVWKSANTMVGRLAFKTRAAAEAYVKDRRNRADKYRIERYLPAPIEEVRDGGP